jgi:hypothetical protein
MRSFLVSKLGEGSTLARCSETTRRQAKKKIPKPPRAEIKELKAATTLHKKKMAKEAKAVREIAKEARKKEREAKAEELAAARAQKQQGKEVANTQKLSQQAEEIQVNSFTVCYFKIPKAASCCGRL